MHHQIGPFIFLQGDRVLQIITLQGLSAARQGQRCEISFPVSAGGVLWRTKKGRQGQLMARHNTEPRFLSAAFGADIWDSLEADEDSWHTQTFPLIYRTWRSKARDVQRGSKRFTAIMLAIGVKALKKTETKLLWNTQNTTINDLF